MPAMKALSYIPSLRMLVVLALVAMACQGGGLLDGTPTPSSRTEPTATPDEGPAPGPSSSTPALEQTAVPTQTAPPPTETSEPPASAQQTCEALPRDAVSTFLYGLAIGTVVGEQEEVGVYCRFETVDVSGTAGDLGRSRAVVTLRLWDNFDACRDAASDLGAEVEDPPSPWTYLRVVPIPNDPSRILSVTAFDGGECLTAAAADVSSQPLDFWLTFLNALAAAR